MKNGIKIIVMILCISASIHTINSNEITLDINNELIGQALNNYAPGAEGEYSIETAALRWAETLVPSLSTAERVALAYQCLNTPSNAAADKNDHAAIDRIIKQMTVIDIPENKQKDMQTYAAELGTEYDVQSVPYLWRTGYGIPGGKLLNWIRRQSGQNDYSKTLVWTNVNDYAQRNAGKIFDTNTQLKNSYIPNILAEAIRDMHTTKFQDNLAAFFRKALININWSNVENNLIDTIYEKILDEYNKIKEPTAALDQEEITEKIRSSIAANAQLKETFKNIQKPIKQKPKKLSKDVKQQLREQITSDTQLAENIIKEINKLDDPLYNPLKTEITQTLANIRKNKPLSTNERQNFEAQLERLKEKQPLAATLMMESTNLDKDQKKWIVTFVANEKQRTGAKQETSRAALLQKITYNYPDNASKRTQEALKLAINNSVQDYFDEVWKQQTQQPQQQNPQPRQQQAQRAPQQSKQQAPATSSAVSAGNLTLSARKQAEIKKIILKIKNGEQPTEAEEYQLKDLASAVDNQWKRDRITELEGTGYALP